jgi:hypothetical protein
MELTISITAFEFSYYNAGLYRGHVVEGKRGFFVNVWRYMLLVTWV